MRCAVLVLAALLLGAATPKTQYVLPDDYFVRTECARLAEAAKDVAKLDAPRAAVERLCARYPAQLGGDAWLTGAEPYRSRIDGYIADPRSTDAKSMYRNVAFASGYRWYATFLIPSDAYVQDAATVATLHRAFRHFGDALEARDVAIWLRVSPTIPQVDTRHSRRLCDRFHFGKLHFGYEGGPYLLLTNRRPDAAGDRFAVVNFHGLDAAGIETVLQRLAQRLNEGGSPDPARLTYDELEQRLAHFFTTQRENIPAIVDLYTKIRH